MEAEPTTIDCQRRASRLASKIEGLSEPYRRNTIAWLESCAARSLQNLDRDLARFLSDLHPDMQEPTATNLEMVLEDAVRHFGQS